MVMKKLLILFALIASVQTSVAQEVGIRFGEVLGNNVAVDGIFELGQFSRIHADVSFGNGVGIEALWDPVFRPVGPEGLNWYAGFGPSMLINDPFFLGISGEVGLDYHFAQVPIAVGVDWRPTFFLIEDTEFYARGFGLNIRYVIAGK